MGGDGPMKKSLEIAGKCWREERGDGGQCPMRNSLGVDARRPMAYAVAYAKEGCNHSQASRKAIQEWAKSGGEDTARIRVARRRGHHSQGRQKAGYRACGAGFSPGIIVETQADRGRFSEH